MGGLPDERQTTASSQGMAVEVLELTVQAITI